jgi:hypothetical protein
MTIAYADLFAALAAQFEPGEVKKRTQANRDLFYITARTAMNRLDDVLGPAGWCMSDQGDDDKSGYSDAFKRACVKFGVGRYLYRDGVPLFVAEKTGTAAVPAHAPAHDPEPARDERRREINEPSRPREQEAQHLPADGGNRRQDGTPKTGRALFAWVKKQEEQHGEGLLRYLNKFAKLQDWPGRMVEWSDAQVQAAHDEACRKLEQRAHEEALSN